MYPKLDYHIETDFVPVGLISSVPQVIVVNPQRVARPGRCPSCWTTCARTRQAQLRLGRQRHLAPPGRRAVQAADQDLHHPHPLPRRRPGAAGPDRRPGGPDVRRPGLVGRAHQGGRIKAIAVAADKPPRASRTCPGQGRKAACPTTRSPPGTACGRPRARPEGHRHGDAAEMRRRCPATSSPPGPAWAPRRPTSGATPSAASCPPRSSAGPRW
jgi:hypothetical protein